ncbi:hypothetical protein KM043_008717 [Ampulex compressa]|nr:hypothetical protein KM043_008717 [Ampulex compressa]
MRGCKWPEKYALEDILQFCDCKAGAKKLGEYGAGGRRSLVGIWPGLARESEEETGSGVQRRSSRCPQRPRKLSTSTEDGRKIDRFDRENEESFLALFQPILHF